MEKKTKKDQVREYVEQQPSGQSFTPKDVHRDLPEVSQDYTNQILSQMGAREELAVDDKSKRESSEKVYTKPWVGGQQGRQWLQMINDNSWNSSARLNVRRTVFNK